MSKTKEYYVTTVSVEILSTYPYSCFGFISELASDVLNSGRHSGLIRQEVSKQVNREIFIELCREHCSDLFGGGKEFEDEEEIQDEQQS